MAKKVRSPEEIERRTKIRELLQRRGDGSSVLYYRTSR